MSESLIITRATPSDAPLLAEHRVAMFRDIGTLTPEFEQPFRDACLAYFNAAVHSGEYTAWLASPANGAPPVAGAGVQIRSLLPRTSLSRDRLLLGREGLVLNVYTEPEWRGRGAARLLMQAIIDWAAESGIVRLVLHASPAGRPLYEKMGFVPTAEMIYTGALAPTGPWTGASEYVLDNP